MQVELSKEQSLIISYNEGDYDFIGATNHRHPMFIKALYDALNAGKIEGNDGDIYTVDGTPVAVCIYFVRWFDGLLVKHVVSLDEALELGYATQVG